jgi:glycosyltransferase involved in cell wall biosynthesis
MSEKKPLFSIIVPVCKTEQYLEQCILSIKSQVFEDFECHIVNDGSSGVSYDSFTENQDLNWKNTVNLKNVNPLDQVKTIFDKLVGLDQRFIYYEKENGGVSSVRNYIRDKLNGRYLITVDADDWIKNNHLGCYADSLKKFTNTNDIIYSSRVEFYNSNEFSFPKPLFLHNINLANLIYIPRLIQWNYISRVDIIQKYKLLSDERIGPGPIRDDKLISHGFDDIIYSWKYLEALAIENSSIEFKFNDLDLDTYMFRSVNRSVKNEFIEKSYIQNANYMKEIAIQNKYFSVKIVSILFPIYIKLLKSPNQFLSKYIVKFVAFPMRLFSRFYF